MLEGLIEAVRKKRPVIHCITNYVTANDCANMVLALGGSPIMADEPLEAAEVAGKCDALVLNTGTFSERTLKAMLLAGRRANQMGIPVILDPVGCGFSGFRTQSVHKLLQEIRFAAVRANPSELIAALGKESHARGVDASEQDGQAAGKQAAFQFAKQYGCVAAVTGSIDYVTDGTLITELQNGHPALRRVTGTGCMCSALVGCFCGCTQDYFAAAAAGVATLGIAGERAFVKVQRGRAGTGSLRAFLIDGVSEMQDSDLSGGLRRA